MTKKSKLFLSAIAAFLVALGVWAYGSAAEPTGGSVVVQKVAKTTLPGNNPESPGYSDYQEYGEEEYKEEEYEEEEYEEEEYEDEEYEEEEYGEEEL